MSSDPRSAFNWKTGERSCMYTEAGERVAQKLEKAGRALDMQGRRTVDLAPRKGSITIQSFDNTAKSQRISRGRSI